MMPSLPTLLWLSFTDPVRLGGLLKDGRGRNTITKVWVGAGALFLLILGLLSQQIIGNPWWLGAWAVLGWSVTLLFIGLAIMATWQARFWLVYSIAPLALLVYGIYAIAILHPWGTLAFYTLFPYYVGTVVSTAGAMWVYKNESWRERFPKVAMTADTLTTLEEWRTVSILRIVLCVVVVVGSLALLFIGPPEERALAGWLVLIGICFGGGILRLESTLAAVVGYPLVVEDAATKGWRTTMVGRFAVWVPAFAFQHLLPPRQSPVVSAAAWIALLEDGGVGRHATRQIARLAPEPLGEFLLFLSMQKGGGDALGLIRPASSPPFQSVAVALQRLAQTGAMPFAMQQWLITLDDAIPPLRPAYPTLATDLEMVHALLLATRLSDDMLKQSTQALQRLKAIFPTDGWLSALVAHGIQHQTALQHPLES